MKAARRAKPSSADHLRKGKDEFLAGRFYLAAEAFAKARDADPRNPVALFNLASAKERIGEVDEAAKLLTEALRLRPSWFEPAQRLALILAKYVLRDAGALDPHGLLAAFAFDRIGHEPLAAAAIDHLRATTALGEAVDQAARGQGVEAARALLLRRTDKVLSDPLLIAAIAAGPNRNAGVERLLVAMRRVILLELPPDRFEDKALIGFIAALIRQCFSNEHVFAVSAEEKRRLDDIRPDWRAAIAGDGEQARRLMLHLLYAPPHALVPVGATAEHFRALRPRAVGELLAERLGEDERHARLADAMPRLGAIADGTSRRVARQYEAHPYPRWTSLHMPAEASALAALKPFFPRERLDFLEKPFRVLIAGAGTGQHALAAAARYGRLADVLAIDLSRRSLAYAKDRADRLGVGNIRFAQADLLDLGEEEPFDIIEAVGVLHHMAEPFKGWRALAARLKPGGLMLAGLYSAIARRGIAALRSEAAYPGPGCGDDEARDYRLSFFSRTDDAASLLRSHDFYTLSEFRDLALHEHERPVFLSEIEAFLPQGGLRFCGFSLPRPIRELYRKAFPGDSWPGALAHWAEFEESHPRVFDGMYQLWCEKTG